MAFKMKGFRAKRSPLKVEDYDSLTEQEKAELYEKIMAEQAEEDKKAERLSMHRPSKGSAY
tara:strand:+ start:505 stop:687 length:183 start_codon:yes stop_codon:yes gene_type:complete